MATIKSTTLTETSDGARRLAKVQFTPQVPNPADQHDVEVVFEIRRLNAPHLEGEPYAVVGPLSVTRTDTREPYTLSEEQRSEVIDAAISEAAEDDGLGWKP
jgi:hypothetical protein